jgi:hypothetical protein
VDVVERYLLLGLRLGRHVDGLVDAYYGPPELAARTDAERPIPPATLAAEADALLADADPDTWLHDQIRGLATYAGIVAGETLRYSDEVERCYGVRPERTSEATFDAAHEKLYELLPGGGLLAERYELWRASQLVAVDRIPEAATAVTAELRTLTEELFGVPEGDEVVLEPVTDEPWLAFNYYLGDLRSRIAINVDLSITGPELIGLLAHETYPGHHAEHAWKEQLLVRDQGLLEESIFLTPTPQAVVSEGIAERGAELAEDVLAPTLAPVLARHGIECDLNAAREVRRARDALETVGLNVALLIHEDGMGEDEALEYVARWAGVGRERAAHTVRFVTVPNWRAYVVTYSAGLELCRAYHGTDPARFRRLLTEQVRVQDLLDAAPVSSGS